MRITKQAEAEWQGDLNAGEGRIQFGGNGAFDARYGFRSRFEDGPGTSPESLIAAAHAACYSMALSHALGAQGHEPLRVHTRAKVHLDLDAAGAAIPAIDLETQAEVPDLDDATFQPIAEDARRNCPVSKILAGAVVSLRARLVAPDGEPGAPTP